MIFLLLLRKKSFKTLISSITSAALVIMADLALKRAKIEDLALKRAKIEDFASNNPKTVEGILLKWRNNAPTTLIPTIFTIQGIYQDGNYDRGLNRLLGFLMDYPESADLLFPLMFPQEENKVAAPVIQPDQRSERPFGIQPNHAPTPITIGEEEEGAPSVVQPPATRQPIIMHPAAAYNLMHYPAAYQAYQAYQPTPVVVQHQHPQALTPAKMREEMLTFANRFSARLHGFMNKLRGSIDPSIVNGNSTFNAMIGHCNSYNYEPAIAKFDTWLAANDDRVKAVYNVFVKGGF